MLQSFSLKLLHSCLPLKVSLGSMLKKCFQKSQEQGQEKTKILLRPKKIWQDFQIQDIDISIFS